MDTIDTIPGATVHGEDLSDLSDRELEIADAIENPHSLYAAGQRHALEDCARYLRNARPGNALIESLARDITEGKATKLGARRRRQG